MLDINDRPPSCDRAPGGVELPTRQRNALRLLLNKPSISPQEVAALDLRVIERAPGIGKKSLGLIDAWLRSHGYALSGYPRTQTVPRWERKQKRLNQAIELLRVYGYEVHRSQ